MIQKVIDDRIPQDTSESSSSSPFEGIPCFTGNNVCGSMVGRSPAMHRLFRQIRWAAPYLRVATVEGEPGVGKTLCARTLHLLGPASRGRFVPCLAKIFFASSHAAELDEARGGMLFLHHVDELGAGEQARLADLLSWFEHTHPVQPGSAAARAPFQIVVSSSIPIRRLATTGTIQVVLSHRLTAIRLSVPPLHQRREDIPLLAQLFLDRFSREYHKPVRGLGPGTLGPLLRYGWPGNVRELNSVLQATALGIDGQWIRPIDLPPLEALAASQALASQAAGPQASQNMASQPRSSTPAATEAGAPPVAAPEDLSLATAAHRHIAAVLARTNGNKLRAARLLHISRSTLYRILADPDFPVV